MKRTKKSGHGAKSGGRRGDSEDHPRTVVEIKRDLRTACRVFTKDALEVVVGIMQASGEFSKAKNTLRFRAAMFILERGWGSTPGPEGDQPPADEYAQSVREATKLMSQRTAGKPH